MLFWTGHSKRGKASFPGASRHTVNPTAAASITYRQMTVGERQALNLEPRKAPHAEPESQIPE